MCSHLELLVTLLLLSWLTVFLHRQASWHPLLLAVASHFPLLHCNLQEIFLSFFPNVVFPFTYVHSKNSGQYLHRSWQFYWTDIIFPHPVKQKKHPKGGDDVVDSEMSVRGTVAKKILRKKNHLVNFLKPEMDLDGSRVLMPSLQSCRIFQFGMAPG